MLALFDHKTIVSVLLFCYITNTSARTLSLSQTTQDAAFGLSNDHSHYDIANSSSALAVPLNAQRVPNNETFSQSLTDVPQFQCSGEAYGIPLIQSCNNAFREMPDGSAYHTFGDRSNQEEYDATLPWRILDSTGTCFIEVTYSESGAFDRETASRLKASAFNLVTFCVGSKHQGGIVKGLGVSGKLQITVQRYQPDVECVTPTGNAPVERSCQDVLADMPAGLEPFKFGRRGTPLIDTSLPLSFASEDFGCVFKVGISGPPTTARWYDLYGVAVAVYSKCGANDLEGSGYLLEGGQRKFMVKLVNEMPRLSSNTATA